jgi:hypothetical protein
MNVMKRVLLSGALLVLLVMFFCRSYAQVVPGIPFSSHDAYKQYVDVLKKQNRNTVHLDSVYEFYADTAGTFKLTRKYYNSYYYTLDYFTQRIMVAISAASFTAAGFTEVEVDTPSLSIQSRMYDGAGGGTPFSSSWLKYDSLFRLVSDSTVMPPVYLMIKGKLFYDQFDRIAAEARKRSILNMSTNQWGPAHPFDSLHYGYHGSSDSLDCVTRYTQLPPASQTYTWHTYTLDQVTAKEDSVNLTGVTKPNSLTLITYNQDGDMVTRLYRRFDTLLQTYVPYDSIVYRYYSPPLAQHFHIDWFVTFYYPEFAPRTRLVREIERFVYYSNYGYRPSTREVYYYNVPGISTPETPAEKPQVTLYPNPAGREFRVVHNLPPNDYQIQIYSLSGRQIVSQPLPGATSTIDTGNLPSGIYLYRIVAGTEVMASGKLVLAN